MMTRRTKESGAGTVHSPFRWLSGILLWTIFLGGPTIRNVIAQVDFDDNPSATESGTDDSSKKGFLSADSAGNGDSVDKTTSSENASTVMEAELLGIQPGKTTTSDLTKHSVFQKAVRKDKSGDYEVFTYQIPDVPETPFVQILVKGTDVSGVVVHLNQPRSLEDGRKSFSDILGNFQPIVIKDNEGNFREIYPERGFSFVLAKNQENENLPSDSITQLVAETIKPDFFLVRASERMKHLFGSSSISEVRKDVETVLSLDPNNASAAWLAASLDLLQEDYSAARDEAVQSVQWGEKVPQFHFTLMAILSRNGEAENGLRYLETVRPLCEKSPLGKAELHLLQGEFLRQKPVPDNDGAITEIQSGISLLEPILKGSPSDNRSQALALTFRAYKSLARTIAQKDWKEKGEKEKGFLWLDAAEPLLKELEKTDTRASEYLLELAVAATEIGLSTPDFPGYDTWVERLTARADEMMTKTSDPAEKNLIRWKRGKGLFNAFLVADIRGDSEKAIQYAEKSFEDLEPFCRENPEKVWSLIGPVDYEFGLLFHNEESHHDMALASLRRAAGFILPHLQNDGSAEDGDQGIRLVNIGKAFWVEGDKENGIDWTERGVEAIEKAVEAGNVDRKELAVPCQNLVIMFTETGDSEKADIYREKVNQNVDATDSAKK